MLTSSIVQFLGWIAFPVCAFLLGNVLRPFFNSYSNEKGKNLATKEDIAQLTKIAEGIKAEISDEVWDRQEQWKLKRDSIQNAVIALHDMESALTELNSCFAVPPGLCDESTREKQEVMQRDALARFLECSIKYQRTMLMVDLVVGIQLSKILSDYFQFANPLAVRIMMEKKPVIESEANRKRAEMRKAVIKSAREALGIKDAGEIMVYQSADAY
jgi:hypothetical protein